MTRQGTGAAEQERARGRVRGVAYEPATGEVRMRDLPAPRRRADEVLVRSLHVGIDGTDWEVVEGEHGEPPEGEDYLVLGHEAVGEVVEAPDGSGFEAGDRVVPLVRPSCGRCPNCRRDAPDLCESGEFTERGIKGRHGFLRDESTAAPEELVKAPRDLGRLAALTEPLSIVVKALETARHVQRRVPWFEDEGGFRGKRALLAGTGSLGSLGAFLLLHEGMDVWAMDRKPHDAPAARFLRGLGVHHVNAKEQDVADVARDVGGFDLVIEATGVPRVAFDLVGALARNGVCVLLGVPGEGEPLKLDADHVMRDLVLGNRVLVGSVNSNRGHYEEALRRIAAFRARWSEDFESLITHTYAPDDFLRALKDDDDSVIKKVVDWRA